MFRSRFGNWLSPHFSRALFFARAQLVHWTETDFCAERLCPKQFNIPDIHRTVNYWQIYISIFGSKQSKANAKKFIYFVVVFAVITRQRYARVHLHKKNVCAPNRQMRWATFYISQHVRCMHSHTFQNSPSKRLLIERQTNVQQIIHSEFFSVFLHKTEKSIMSGLQFLHSFGYTSSLLKSFVECFFPSISLIRSKWRWTYFIFPDLINVSGEKIHAFAFDEHIS